MIALEKNCKLVITDSGGVQKEAFFFNKYCVILRPETEWIELVNAGAAMLADADEDKIKSFTQTLLEKPTFNFENYYGDGKAAQFICSKIVEHIQVKK
jgi:UDP-GlcNAc3NAcA epimerase